MKKAIIIFFIIFCVALLWFLGLKKQDKYVIDNITTTTTETVRVLDESPKTVKGPGFCVRNAKNITTEMQDNMVVAKYEEYIFKCLCKGKLLDDFTFKSSNSIAGEICDNQCAELCQKVK